MRSQTLLLAIVALLVALPGVTWGGDASLSGYVPGEIRLFPNKPLLPGQFETSQPSFLASPEFRYRTDEGKDQFTLIPFLRLDGRDGNRTHFDLREAYWLRRGDGWDMTVGLNYCTIFSRLCKVYRKWICQRADGTTCITPTIIDAGVATMIGPRQYSDRYGRHPQAEVFKPRGNFFAVFEYVNRR